MSRRFPRPAVISISALVAARGIGGKDVTPVLLAHFHEGSGGASLRANLALVRANAALAAQVAAAVGRRG